jgi:hypothetical protein
MTFIGDPSYEIMLACAQLRYGGKRMSHQRRYRVSGTDAEGDVHAFETNNQESDEEMRAIMGEDLQGVKLEDRNVG